MRANESGCLVGVLAADGPEGRYGSSRGGPEDPAGRHLIAGYRTAPSAVPGTKVIINTAGLLSERLAQDRRREPDQQGAGSPGRRLRAGHASQTTRRHQHGVDVDQYALAKNVLTSGVKRVDQGVYLAIAQVKAGKFNGGGDLVFNLKNGGMGVGKITPTCPRAFIALMNVYKARIIAGKLKPKAAL
jgi:basic membrane lipoprotein Med (substrate-binding protein (PBP1-ABC) superfamily)